MRDRPLMPMYPRRCPSCSHRWEDFAHTAQVRETDLSTLLPCPRCASASETDYADARIARGYRTFDGRGGLSLTEGCHPSEVRAMRRLVGPDLEGCVGDDGQMRFDDSRQRRDWDKAMDRLRARERSIRERRAQRDHATK